MKTRSIPTSPKNQKDIKVKKGLDEIYNDKELSTIERPLKNSKLGLIATLMLAIIFGFIAGFLGHIILIAYGPDIPILNQLDILTQYDYPKSIVLKGQNKLDQKIISQIQEVRTKVSPSIVEIYNRKDVTGESLSNVYINDELRGYGMIVSNDGVVITSATTIGNFIGEYVAITSDREIYEIKNPVQDPVTDLVFANIDDENLETVGFSDLNSVTVGEGVIIVHPTVNDAEESVFTGVVTNKFFQDQSSIDSIVENSEKYSTSIQLNVNTDKLLAGDIVFDFDGNAVGISMNEQDTIIQRIVPFEYVETALNQFLSSGSIKRPYLGVNYIDLARTINLPESMTNGRTSGALIYSTDEENLPSIISNSPAEKAGLQKEDIIIKVDNSVLNHVGLSEEILILDVGDLLELTILRDDVEEKIKVELEKNVK